ncbi:recombinase RecT [Candidatus Pacearchaeota archaeon]|jgi:phage RecT family recombinase|nr:recombinase RecT [Candidatus Pacearchaeota archaeon]
MSNDLIVSDQRIAIPPPQHQGFTALVRVVERLPQYFPPGAAGAQLAAGILSEANKKSLSECTSVSVVKTAFNAAVLGLIPGDFLGMCHFVPFKKECQLIVGYKGWLELAYDGDFLADMHSEVVLKGEEFTRWNDENGPHIRHAMSLDRDGDLAWPNVVASYCVWHSRSGGKGLEVVGRKALETLKRRGNVWDSNPVAMCLKTPILRASKTWKRTRRMAVASALDDAIESNAPQPPMFDGPAEPIALAPPLSAFEEGENPERQPSEDNADESDMEFFSNAK